MLVLGKPIVYGIQEPLPLVGFPPGNYEIRMSADGFICVCVHTSDGIREFSVEENDGTWIPAFEFCRNIQDHRREASV